MIRLQPSEHRPRASGGRASPTRIRPAAAIAELVVALAVALVGVSLLAGPGPVAVSTAQAAAAQAAAAQAAAAAVGATGAEDRGHHPDAHAGVLPPPSGDGARVRALGSGSTDVGRYYAVRSAGSGLCLDVAWASTSPGAAVVQYTCGSAKVNQRFWFRQLAADTYQLAAKHSGHCLRIVGASTAPGALVEQQPCATSGTGLTGSRFTVRQVGTASPPTYQLVTDTGGLCLESPSTSVGARVRQNTCRTTSAFLWTFGAELAPAPSATTGRWSAVYPMPSTPVSAAVLPNGKVLTFASTLAYASVDGAEQTHTLLLDPAKPTEPLARVVTHTVHDMFCPGTAMLADGRLIVNGGDFWVTAATSIYDYATDTWTRGPVMHQPRWYNTSLTLPSGDVFTLGGNRQAGYDGNGEIWLRATNSWKALPGARLAPTLTADPANRAHEHPRLFVAPNGRIFFAGPSRAMQWYDVAGTGNVTSAGTRADDEVSQSAITVMYDVGKILKAGGNTHYGYQVSGSFVPSNRLAYAIDITAGSGPATVSPLPPMTYPRAYANGVVLPTGQVLVVGGSDHGRLFSDDGAVLVPELFDPRTRRWTELAPMATPRGYHSVAVLLPDGRVLVGGGGFCGSATECLVNHRNIEIYSPPYLFAGTRPRIDWAPSATIAARGGTFTVSVTGTVTGFTLVRLSSVTHGVNTDQRFLRLSATGSGTTRTVTAPASANLAPPGYYMLFAMNGDVPSVARIVRLG